MCEQKSVRTRECEEKSVSEECGRSRVCEQKSVRTRECEENSVSEECVRSVCELKVPSLCVCLAAAFRFRV